jgi:hypothetical protein
MFVRTVIIMLNKLQIRERKWLPLKSQFNYENNDKMLVLQNQTH